MPLGLPRGQHLVSNRSFDPESYEQYLRAKPADSCASEGVLKPKKSWQPLVARNPDYAPDWPSWRLLTLISALGPGNQDEVNWPKSEEMARRAIQLDPILADAYFAWASAAYPRQACGGRRPLCQGASRSMPKTLMRCSCIAHLSNVGRPKTRSLEKQLRALEPYVPAIHRGFRRYSVGRTDRTPRHRDTATGIRAGCFPVSLAMIYASRRITMTPPMSSQRLSPKEKMRRLFWPAFASSGASSHSPRESRLAAKSAKLRPLNLIGSIFTSAPLNVPLSPMRT